METETNLTLDKKETNENISATSVVMTSMICSIVTVVIAFISYIYLYKPYEALNQSINKNQQQISEVKESIIVSRQELETQMKSYIAENYGELSERDEKVDKLVIYFRQQEARLSNIEKALSKF